jgi:opacity protein-like surface antigen
VSSETKKPSLEVTIMKSLIKAVAIAALLAAPVASFAQAADTTQQPMTRAEVKNQLIQLEQAGYNPARADDATYPADIQAAEQRVQAENPPVAQNSVADTSGYGPATSGTSASGSMQPMQPVSRNQDIYFGGH